MYYLCATLPCCVLWMCLCALAWRGIARKLGHGKSSPLRIRNTWTLSSVVACRRSLEPAGTWYNHTVGKVGSYIPYLPYPTLPYLTYEPPVDQVRSSMELSCLRSRSACPSSCPSPHWHKSLFPDLPHQFNSSHLPA